MSRRLHHFLGLSCLGWSLLLSACQPASLSPEALVAYVANPAHGLCQQQQAAGTDVTVTYQPAELLIARELPAAGPGKAALDSLRKQYGHAAYFLVAISRDGRGILQPSEGFSHYSELLQTLAFRAPEYVQLITSRGDTLRPVNYYLDRTSTSAEATQLLLAFAKLPATGSWQLHLRECGFATGDLTFAFDARQATTVPALSLP